MTTRAAGRSSAVRPRIASRPASPAFEECRWTSAGCSRSTIRRTCSVSRSEPGPGARLAVQSTCFAPAASTRSARPSYEGAATITCQPRRAWSATASSTYLPTPPSVGWETCRMVSGPRTALRLILHAVTDAKGHYGFGVIDLHTHVLPGIDDGARSLDGLAGARAGGGRGRDLGARRHPARARRLPDDGRA